MSYSPSYKINGSIQASQPNSKHSFTGKLTTFVVEDKESGNEGLFDVQSNMLTLKASDSAHGTNDGQGGHVLIEAMGNSAQDSGGTVLVKAQESLSLTTQSHGTTDIKIHSEAAGETGNANLLLKAEGTSTDNFNGTGSIEMTAGLEGASPGEIRLTAHRAQDNRDAPGAILLTASGYIDDSGSGGQIHLTANGDTETKAGQITLNSTGETEIRSDKIKITGHNNKLAGLGPVSHVFIESQASTTLTESNANNKIKLATGDNWSDQKQSLYYADNNGYLQLLQGGTAADGVAQFLKMSTTGVLSWSDAESSSLQCLGMTSAFNAGVFTTAGGARNSWEMEIAGGADNFTIPLTGSLTIEDESKRDDGSKRGVTGEQGVLQTLLWSNGSDQPILYFQAMEGGNYQVNVSVDFDNGNGDDGIDVSGKRVLEIRSIAAAPDVSGNTTVDATLSNSNVVYSVETQPNPDSETLTRLSACFSKRIEANVYLFIVTRVGDTTRQVLSAVRTFDCHYVCD